MKTSILFLLALALVVETIQAQGGKSKSRAGGKKVMKKGPKHGPFVPCWRFKNLKSCTCKDNKEYKKGGGKIWKKCGGYKRIQSCECKKGPKWINEEKYVPPKE